MRPILTSPRIIRTGQPLALGTIKQVCPAVFANEAHESRGPRYRYVPTIEPLEMLLDNGWGVYEASQQRSRDGNKDPYTKHMLRLRRMTDFDQSDAQSRMLGLDGVPEVILINAHDGTAAYHLKAGFFRFVCSNGLMVGSHITGFKVVHTVNSQTSKEVLEAGQRVVTENFPAMLENVARFKRITLTSAQAYRLAETGLKLRYGNQLPSISATQLLECRRPEDEEPTLWNYLNRVQEAALYGGFDTVSIGNARRVEVRPVTRVSAVAKINGGIWDEALALAEEVEA